MKKSIVKLLAIAAIGVPAAAMAQGVAGLDTDTDGVVSLAELQAVHMDVTAETFAAADANGDGMLDEAELTAAQDSGALPAPSEG